MYTRIAAALALTTALLHGGSALAQQKLTLAHWVPPVHPLQVHGMEPWAESIKQATEGRVTIEIYPAQQLGAAADHYDMARDGIADISFISPGYQPGRFPIIDGGALPFHFTNAKAGVAAMTEWYKKYSDLEMGDVYFCMAVSHHPGTFHARSQILVPDDIKGKTFRPANSMQARFISSMGGASVQVSAAEMREILSSGTADGTQSPWESLYIFGVQDVVTHHLDIPLYLSPNLFVINKAKLEGLPEADRKVIEDHCTPEWAEKMSSEWADIEAAGRDKIAADSAHTIHTPNAEQLQMWKDAAEPMVGEWKKVISDKGWNADEMYDDLVETIKKYDSFAG